MQAFYIAVMEKTLAATPNSSASTKENDVKGMASSLKTNLGKVGATGDESQLPMDGTSIKSEDLGDEIEVEIDPPGQDAASKPKEEPRLPKGLFGHGNLFFLLARCNRVRARSTAWCRKNQANDKFA